MKKKKKKLKRSCKSTNVKVIKNKHSIKPKCKPTKS